MWNNFKQAGIVLGIEDYVKLDMIEKQKQKEYDEQQKVLQVKTEITMKGMLEGMITQEEDIQIQKAGKVEPDKAS
jgi:hypothetical protein